VSLSRFRAEGFRCLSEISIEPHPRLNLITGANASGKTSLLEAIYYLGRGRSFRASSSRELIRTGAQGFTLFGLAGTGERTHRAGVEVEPGERRGRVDGQPATSADLAKVLPVQAIDPEVHSLVQGAPEFRRRFLDWGVFHVKHDYLLNWRRYQTALRQRNAALRRAQPPASVRAFDAELVTAGERVAQQRREYFTDFMQLFSPICSEILPFDVICGYSQGWAEGSSFAEALAQSWPGDCARGTTQTGPHRADLRLQVQARRARYRVSRGQQKLLAATLMVTQVRHAAPHVPAELLLLVDDPAAELDRDNRNRLFALLHDVPAQLFITALDRADLPADQPALRLHLDDGTPTTLL
jgi:DNA replication and repair protein RecF